LSFASILVREAIEMAKWGEGDPRWIVEERPDATNVNNWHWTEKNADQWSKDRLKELLCSPIEYGSAVGDEISMTEMCKCEGEARVNNRKAKLIFFYEWDLEFKFKTKKDKISGKVSIPNLSEEHSDMKDVDLEITLDSDSDGDKEDKHRVKEYLRKGGGAQEIRRRLQEYVDSLKHQYSQGVVLETKTNTPKQASSTDSTNGAKSAMQTMSIKGKATAPSSSASAAAADFEDINCKERFKCTGQEMFNALTQREMIQVFTSAPVVMSEAKAGERFEMLGGNIQGEFVEVKPYSRVVMKWRLRSWKPESHFSTVEMEIEQNRDDTTLRMKQKRVPSSAVDTTKQGWKVYYWEAIRRSFGFGSSL